MNLRWTWHGPTQDLFAGVDEAVWRSCGGDPVRMLGEVRPQRLAELAEDAGFVGRVQERAEELRAYLREPRWYQGRASEGLPSAIGYFSMEFGVSEVLPNYSGGLGILAGDHLKAASDLGVPLVAVGLLYRSGYFRQSLSLDGWQQEQYPALDPQGLPLHLLADSSGEQVLVGVAMPGGRTLRARVWVASVGRVPLLLLDADIEENDPDLRQITDRLYGGDAEHRIRQEILVGIGGVRAVRAFCGLTGHPAPEVFHTNEGHAGFLGLERIRELVADAGLDFEQALATVRAGTVFTTHTPVPAGIDRFPVGLVEHYFTADMLPGIEPSRVLSLGREPAGDMFNMAHMGLRLAQRSNGVSQLHGEVSRGMFQSLWGGFDAPEVPIGSVTNGVHGPTWTAREIGGLTAGAEASGSPELFGVSDSLLWELRGTLRRRLVEEVRRRVRASWLQRGASDPELAWTERIFDPDVLTIGFARRVPTYKRLTLMLRDPERLKSILLDPERPVQLVIAGKSHPADESGKALIQQMVHFADDNGVRHRIAFLPDYDMSMARYLYWGCDVWLNNPLRPLEACGTSGMKSALNGGLNLSVRDGWWDELYDGRNGWAIPTPRRHRGERPLRPAHDAGRPAVLRPRRRRRARPLDRARAPHPRDALAEGAGDADGHRLRRAVVRPRRPVRRARRGRRVGRRQGARDLPCAPRRRLGVRGRRRGRRLGRRGHPGARGADDRARGGRARRPRPLRGARSGRRGPRRRRRRALGVDGPADDLDRPGPRRLPPLRGRRRPAPRRRPGLHRARPAPPRPPGRPRGAGPGRAAGVAARSPIVERSFR